MGLYNIDRNKFLNSFLFYIFKSTGVIFLSSFSPDIFSNASKTSFNFSAQRADFGEDLFVGIAGEGDAVAPGGRG